jgi:ABC-type nitrate/sulfonate/bicarbonate transport system substrate-binding protein
MSRSATGAALRIGVHPNNLHLVLASRWPGAFGVHATFVAHDEGRDTGRLIADGVVDVGGTGSTPPILEQVRGLDVRYVAASAPRPANGALMVRADGRERRVRDLVGRRVALIDGSFHTYLLARLLEEDGLRLGDVARVEAGPEEGRRALAEGRVDGWIAMAPLLDEAKASGEARVLAACGDVIPNRSVFWTIGSRIAPSTAAAVAAALARVGAAAAADPERAADLLAGPDAAPAMRAGWLRTVLDRDWRVEPAGPVLFAEQHREAQVLHRHGVIDAVPFPLGL